MPELPEVETIKRILAPQLCGRRVENVQIRNAQVIAHPRAETFAERLTGKMITGLSRRGKFLRIELENGGLVCLHLRMTGQLMVTPAEFSEEKHTHLIAALSDGNQLRYIDVRRFGRFWYLDKGETDAFTGLERLGIEPDDPGLTADYLYGKLGTKKKCIKEMLHDQSVVAGIGNIYSDEILFDAGVCPEKKCSELRADQWNRLAVSIPKIIAWGIETDAMTPEEYLAGKGREYRNMPELKVYGRAGMPCRRCGSPLKQLTIGGRSSCFCPECQKS